MGKGKNKHRRRANAALKARRAASWLRGQRRKEHYRQENAQLAAAKARRRAAGELTPRDLAWAEVRERAEAARVRRAEVKRQSTWRQRVPEPRARGEWTP